MKKYFANITTAQELKKAYKRLCLKLHPDKGGDPAEFKAMQAEYEDMEAVEAFIAEEAPDKISDERTNRRLEDEA